MSDVFTKKKRSEVMSRIRGKGNRKTELRLASYLRRAKIWGWRRHYHIIGKPDFAFPKVKLAVFVDGCFWHGCPSCYQPPKNNASFWKKKLLNNRARDIKVSKSLNTLGWSVLRIRECRLRSNPESCVYRILRKLDQKGVSA